MSGSLGVGVDGGSCLPRPRPLVMSAKPFEPPTVFVDSNDGIIAKKYTPQKYTSTNATFTSIRECGSILFASTTSEISAGIIVDGEYLPCISKSADEFFGIDVPDGAAISIVSVVMVSPETFLVSAAANVEPSIDRVIVVSKTIDRRSIILSIGRRISHESETITMASKWSSIFDEGGEYIGDGSEEEEVLTMDSYSGSYGFGDVASREYVFSDNGKDAMLDMAKDVVDDIAAAGGPDIPVGSGDVYGMYSVETSNGVFVVSISKDRLSVGGTAQWSQYFEEQNTMSGFWNTRFAPIFEIRDRKPAYRDVYTHAGIFRIRLSSGSVSVSRGCSKDGGAVMAGYDIDVTEDPGESISATSTIEYAGSTDDMCNVFYSKNIRINCHPFDGTSIAAKNFNTMHLACSEGTYVGQEEDIISVRCMSNFEKYGAR